MTDSALWLVCERQASDERKYYLSNHAKDVALSALIKRRWVCEQMRTS